MSSYKVVIVGGGPVGALAGLYAAQRGFQVEIYEMRDGASTLLSASLLHFPVPFCSNGWLYM